MVLEFVSKAHAAGFPYGVHAGADDTQPIGR